ncbi:hypothetical protein [Patulibacter sp. SYSU D01012]|uniref:hypothetical protein n=1 Tax=Patulibacter sp. SYSU D01012 TaxID=2817381 RepID=UPI001B3072F1|nr:hypothetical protein [Patulibacter sp. SYSU D01012]
MSSPRAALPIVVTGTTGVALLAAGVLGLTGMEPRLEGAAAAAAAERRVQAVPHQLVDCPPERRAPRPKPEV